MCAGLDVARRDRGPGVVVRIRSDIVVAVLWLTLVGAGPGLSANPVRSIQGAAGPHGSIGSVVLAQAAAPAQARPDSPEAPRPEMLVLAAALVGIGGFAMYHGWRMDRAHRHPDDGD